MHMYYSYGSDIYFLIGLLLRVSLGQDEEETSGAGGLGLVPLAEKQLVPNSASIQGKSMRRNMRQLDRSGYVRLAVVM